MKLDVIESPSRAWYADGLQFTCTECGNCCTGGPGAVWISKAEIGRLAKFLNLTPSQTIEQYCRRIDGRYSLNEIRNARGEYDCVFLREEKIEPGPRGEGQYDEAVVQTKRTCAIYSVRPLQCRTWPFWDGNLSSQDMWNRSAVRCPGMNCGKHFNFEQIEALRTAKDWPRKAPTSAEEEKPKRSRPKKR